MRTLQYLATFLSLSLILLGCSGGSSDSEEEVNEDAGPADEEGYVLDKTEDAITIVWDIPREDVTQGDKKEILESAKPHALTVTYTDTSNFSVGDRVSIWTTGNYDDSYPLQGVATDIKKAKEG